MARQVIDTTTDHGTYKGDPAKLAFDKANDNFAELYSLIALGGDNLLINCGVPINQRGFAGGALAAGAYGYDRWKAGSGGCNVTINAGTGAFTHTSGPLQQIVESPAFAWGLPLTISVENPSGSIAVSVGGATGTITAGSGRRGVTLTPSGSGNMTVQMTATGVTYLRPKLERGSSATPFVPRPQALELLICQRYFEKSFQQGQTPALGQVAASFVGAVFTGSAVVKSQNVQFSVRKRATPSITLYPPPDGSSQTVGRWGAWNGGQFNSSSICTVRNANDSSFAVDIDFGSGPASYAAYVIQGHWTADAEL